MASSETKKSNLLIMASSETKKSNLLIMASSETKKRCLQYSINLFGGKWELGLVTRGWSIKQKNLRNSALENTRVSQKFAACISHNKSSSSHKMMPAVVGSIMLVGALTCCALLYFTYDLKIA